MVYDKNVCALVTNQWKLKIPFRFILNKSFIDTIFLPSKVMTTKKVWETLKRKIFPNRFTGHDKTVVIRTSNMCVLLPTHPVVKPQDHSSKRTWDNIAMARILLFYCFLQGILIKLLSKLLLLTSFSLIISYRISW